MTMESTAIALAFPGVSRPIHLQDAPEVLGHLHNALSGWQPSLRQGSKGGRPLASLVGARGHYVLCSTFLDAPLTLASPAAAFCGLVADLARGWLDDRPDEIALHAGAASVDGRGIIFAGEARAGKSTLMARLTAEPWARVLGDDVVPVTPEGSAMALGVPPRLRMPLPPGASDRFRAHVAAHLGPHDCQYAYLDAGLVAPHGTTVPIRYFVALSRRDRGPASLHHLPLAEATAHILTRNMTTTRTDGLLLERVAALAADLMPFRLVYSDLEDAVALLRHAFQPTTLDRALIRPALPADDGLGDTPACLPVNPDAIWQRSPGVGLRRRGEALLLWQPETNAGFMLNAVAAAVWTLLEEPGPASMIADVLQEVFPDAGTEQIAGDVSLLLGQLAEAGLIGPVIPVA